MVGFSTLRELIGKTPAKSQDWLQLLLELTTAEREQVFTHFILKSLSFNASQHSKVAELKSH